METNKFNIMSRDALLRGVQDLGAKLEEEKVKAKNKTAWYLRSMGELRQARNALISKLGEVDRNTPEFFPVRSRIVYHKPHPLDDVFDFTSKRTIAAPARGHVHAHQDGMIVFAPEGTGPMIKVWPAHCKLLYIS
jgi:hypothetical protein